MCKRKISGFTLVELLIAMFIFSILTAFAFRATSILSQSSVALEQEQDALMELQKAILLIEKDVRQASKEFISNASHQQNQKVGLSFLGANGEGSGEGEALERRIILSTGVGYYLSEGVLHREVTQSEKADLVLKLIRDVSDFNLSPVMPTASGRGQAKIVSGVELAISHKQYGKVQRMIYLGLGQVDESEVARLTGRLQDASASATTMSEDDMSAVLGL